MGLGSLQKKYCYSQEQFLEDHLQETKNACNHLYKRQQELEEMELVCNHENPDVKKADKYIETVEMKLGQSFDLVALSEEGHRYNWHQGEIWEKKNLYQEDKK